MVKNKLTAKSIAAQRAMQKAAQEGTKQDADEVLKVLPSEYTYLSEEQLKLISALSDEFKDIHQLEIAKVLRSIERDQVLHSHRLIEIGKYIGNYGVHEPHPYFSVKLGEDGLKVVS